MTKPTTKLPAEIRLRKDIRALLQDYAKDTSTKNTDHVVREFLALIDDEVRRTRMSIAPVIDTTSYPMPKSWKLIDSLITSKGMTS